MQRVVDIKSTSLFILYILSFFFFLGGMGDNFVRSGLGGWASLGLGSRFGHPIVYFDDCMRYRRSGGLHAVSISIKMYDRHEHALFEFS